MTTRYSKALPALLALFLAGCGALESMNKGGGSSGSSGSKGLLEDFTLWPFGASKVPEKSRVPANATEYRCDGGRRFYVRPMAGSAVWLIAPDREIRLPRIDGAEARYGVGRVLLEITGESAALVDPPAVFSNCKRPGKVS